MCVTYHLPSLSWLPLLHHWCRERFVQLGVHVRPPFLLLTCLSSSIKVAFLLGGWVGWPSEPLVFKSQFKHSMKSVLLPLHTWMRSYGSAGTFSPMIRSTFFPWIVKNLHPPTNRNIVWWARNQTLETDHLVLNLVLLFWCGHAFFNSQIKNKYL